MQDDGIAVLALVGSPMCWPAPAWLTRRSELVLKSAVAPEDTSTLKDSRAESSRTDGSVSSRAQQQQQQQQQRGREQWQRHPVPGNETPGVS